MSKLLGLGIEEHQHMQVKGLWDLWPLPWSGFKMQPLQSPPEVGAPVHVTCSGRCHSLTLLTQL